MPRVKSSHKSDGSDPIYTQARWGKKNEAAPAVRSTGRIKKAKTIFDPSEETGPQLGVTPTVKPERVETPGVPEKRRRLSVVSTSTSQVSTISAKTNLSTTDNIRTNATPAIPLVLPPVTNPKKRRVEKIVDPNARPKQSPVIVPTKPVASLSPVILNNSHNSLASSSPVKPTAVTISKPVSLLKNPQTNPPSKSVPRARGYVPRANQNAILGAASLTSTVVPTSPAAPVTKPRMSVGGRSDSKSRKSLSFQCCICNKYDSQLDVAWMKCNNCMVNVHKDCTLTYKQKGPWMCRKCTICFDCEDELNVDEAACCHKCFISFHISCLDADELSPEGVEWTCKYCKNPKRIINKGVANAVNPTETVQMVQGEKARQNLLTPQLDALGKVPDASKWSAHDVYVFFAERFPKEALVFQEQEIDGVSLLLMRRSDVIQGLGFKLGPALRIYKQILMLQTRDTDPTLTWY